MMIVGGMRELSTLQICQGRLCVVSADSRKLIAVHLCSLDQDWAGACLVVDYQRWSGLILEVLYRHRHIVGLDKLPDLGCRRS